MVPHPLRQAPSGGATPRTSKLSIAHKTNYGPHRYAPTIACGRPAHPGSLRPASADRADPRPNPATDRAANLPAVRQIPFSAVLPVRAEHSGRARGGVAIFPARGEHEGAWAMSRRIQLSGGP